MTKYKIIKCGNDKFIKLNDKLVVNINKVFAIKVVKDSLYLKVNEERYLIYFLLNDDTYVTISGFKSRDSAIKELNKILELISD